MKIGDSVNAMSKDAVQLMREAYRARREDRPDDARRDFGEAVAQCRRGGRRRELVQALKGLAQIERDAGRDAVARPLYEEAVVLCRLENDPLLLAHTVRHLGDLHQDAGRDRLAEPCYHEALSIYRGHKATSSLDLANALRPLAFLKEKAGETEEAMRLWDEARSLYEAVDVRPGVAECSAHLARLSQRAAAIGRSGRTQEP